MEKKLNFAGIIIGMLFIMGYQTPAAAEEAIKLETTIVTATKTEKELSGITASVDVITSAEIKMMGASTIYLMKTWTRRSAQMLGPFSLPE